MVYFEFKLKGTGTKGVNYKWDQLQTAKNQENQCLRTEGVCPSSSREQIYPSSALLFYLGPQWIGWYQPAMELIFTHSSYLYYPFNVNLIWRLSYRHTQKYVLPAITLYLKPVKLTYKIDHLITYCPRFGF